MKYLFVALMCMGMIACTKTDIPSSAELPSPSDPSNTISRLWNECSSETAVFPDYSSYSFDDRCAFAGTLHNQYLDYFLNGAVANNIKPTDSTYDEDYRNITKSFFEEQGFSFDEDLYGCPSTTEPDENYQEYFSELSDSAKLIFNAAYSSIENIEISMTEFTSEMESLYLQAKNLDDEKERISLCLMIKVGLSSAEYWESNVNSWVDYFGEGGENKLSSTAKIGISDAVGAFMGAIRGFLWGGPVGAFAGAVLNAGWNSCTRAVIYGATGY